MSDCLLDSLGPIFEISIAYARIEMPKLIRSSEVFVSANAKRADGPPAVLIGMTQLERVVQEANETTPR